jgi:hypothetical protein
MIEMQQEVEPNGLTSFALLMVVKSCKILDIMILDILDDVEIRGNNGCGGVVVAGGAEVFASSSDVFASSNEEFVLSSSKLHRKKEIFLTRRSKANVLEEARSKSKL